MKAVLQRKCKDYLENFHETQLQILTKILENENWKAIASDNPRIECLQDFYENLIDLQETVEAAPEANQEKKYDWLWTPKKQKPKT